MVKGTKIQLDAEPFPLSRVTLLEGPFKHAMELQKKSLLQYDPDRLLAKFRINAGLKPKAEHYKGWESKTIAGHSLGHHLSGCSLMFKATGDPRFKKRVHYIVQELAKAQKADGDGYVGAIPDGKRILSKEVAKGDIRSKAFQLNGLWVPLYVHHKVMAGLRDACRLAGESKALKVEKRLADWICDKFMPLSEEDMQKVLACEHGGINEVFAGLYADTGKERYLKMAERFYHKEILDPLSKGKDILPGIHANTQFPKLTGLARLYELTGKRKYKRTAEFFWDRVVNHHTYVTGGNGNGEYFGQPDVLAERLSSNTTETCNVYNMLKLSRHIFQWSADEEVPGFMERAIFNHMLTSQHPETGNVTYNLSLKMGGHIQYQKPYYFTCCIGTGMENHQKYGRFIYFHDEEGLFVNQFIASELNWAQRRVKVLQETGFPVQQGTKLSIRCAKASRFKLRIRVPYWLQKELEIEVNGKQLPVGGHPPGYVVLKRKWENGDTVRVNLPFSLRLESMPDDRNRVAVMYGPLVLAGDLGPRGDPKANESDYVPVLALDGRNPSDWLKPVDGASNTFRMVKAGKPRNVTLKPLYKLYDRNLTVYWDIQSSK